MSTRKNSRKLPAPAPARRFAQWCGFAGLGVVVFFDALALFAILLRPDYAVATGYLSELGVGVSALFFNAAVIVSGLLGVAFYYALDKLLPSSVGEKIGVGAGFLAGFFLALVGVFPFNQLFMHTLVAVLFFVSAALSASALALYAKSEKIVTRSVRAAGFLVALLVLLFLATGLGTLETLAVLAYQAFVAGVALNARALAK